MSISTLDNTIQYTGNGATTIFTFPYLFFNNVDLLVTETDTITNDSTYLAIGTDYTVSGAGAPGGGQITLLSATPIPNTVRLTIERIVAITQPDHYIPNDSFPSATAERDFDKLTMIAQQLNDAVTRSLVFPSTDPSGVSAVLPPLATRAGMALSFDSNGLPIAIYSPDTGESAAAAAASAAAALASQNAAAASDADAATQAGLAEAAAVAAAASAASIKPYDENQYGTDVTNTNSYTLTLSPAPTSYSQGMQVSLKITNANTGATTLNVNGLGAKNVLVNGSACVGGEIIAGRTAQLLYDGTQFQLLNSYTRSRSRVAYFTASGTFTPPAGCFDVETEVQAAGGGAPASGGTATQGGGGGGGYGRSIVSVTPGTGVAVTVGAGSSAANGGNSSFGTLCVANGGGVGGSGGTSGAGGTVPTADFKRPGQAASAGVYTGSLAYLSQGGNSALGQGGTTAVIAGGTAASAPGINYGGGASGSGNTGAAGAGAGGIVIVHY